MKRLINKVLLALITLSIAAPVSAGVDPGMFKGLEYAYGAGVALGLVGGPVAGGVVALGLKKAYDKWHEKVYGQGFNDAKSQDDSQPNQKAFESSMRSKVITFVGGALLGGCAGAYFIDKIIFHLYKIWFSMMVHQLGGSGIS